MLFRSINALQLDWAGGLSDTDPNNAARWSEIHPPDIIDVMDPSPTVPFKVPTETVRGVTVFAGSCWVPFFACNPQALDADIAPPGPPPQPTSIVNVSELVSSFTNFRTIVQGNSTLAGAQITIGPSSAHIHIAVQAQPGFGAPGKFAAFYRVSWK